MLVKSVFSLRSRSHLATRLQLRDERAHAYRLSTWIAAVFILFALVDHYARPKGDVGVFVAVRLAAIIISRLSFVLLRGRAKYLTRLVLTTAPYLIAVEYIMISQDLIVSPYFAGLTLVLVTSAMLFPIRTASAFFIYGGCTLPLVLWLAFNPLPSMLDNVNALLMAIGSVVVCAINAGELYKDFCERLKATEALARDLGVREKEIRKKADEIVKRRIFESQFSPQVVEAILTDRSITREMRRSKIVNVVIDIQNSTKKAHALVPSQYKEVVEEVFDVFSAACLKWDITLDKFLGDGAQAFAGAPIERRDDLYRAVMACGETMKMLSARRDALEALWKEELNVRFAVCEGEALVGFIGRGAFKSYTAVGDMVSFTHRLGGVPEPWTIATYIWGVPVQSELTIPGFSSQIRIVGGLKGFDDKKFAVCILSPDTESNVGDVGRCSACETPLVVGDGPMGMPRVYCPACNGQASEKLNSVKTAA